MILFIYMKSFLYTFLILFSLLFINTFLYANFSDTAYSPNSNNKSGPIDSGGTSQSKNATLSVQEFTAGVTANLFKINSFGNVSVASSDMPSSSVRMIVKGQVKTSSLSGGTGNHPICIGSTLGSYDNGYPLVRCD